MAAPEGNKNAQKDDENRVMYSVRLPPSLVQQIKRVAKNCGKSQSDLIIEIFGQVLPLDERLSNRESY